MEALQKAQPKDLDASEIDVRLGATWIDADYIQQFMEETFEMCIRDSAYTISRQYNKYSEAVSRNEKTSIFESG